MNIDSHLFLDKLEQMRELLSSPDIESRANTAFLTQIIKDFYSLIDEYAVAQIPEAKDPEKIKAILAQLTSKIDIIEQHVQLETDKLSFLSKVTPKS